MLNLNENHRIILAQHPSDMCMGFNGLCGCVRSVGLSLTNGDVYIFVGKSRRIMKLLHWERGGYVYIIKLHEEFYTWYGTEPLYAQCDIMWKSDEDSHVYPEPATFKLSMEVDDTTDDKISFYCNGIGNLIYLAEFSGEDFILTDCIRLMKELEL